MFGCVLVFLLFSTQMQITQIIILMGRVIYHIEALSVVNRKICENFQKIVPVLRKMGWKFVRYRLISASKVIE